MAKASITRFWDSKLLGLSDLYLVFDQNALMRTKDEEYLMAVDITERLMEFASRANLAAIVLTDETVFRAVLDAGYERHVSVSSEVEQELRKLSAIAVLLNGNSGK